MARRWARATSRSWAIGIVHSVVNPLGKISAAIHVYLGNFLEIERSMWDAETLVEEP